MHIGIDARFVQGSNTTGVTNYLIHLLKCISSQDKSNVYSIFCSSPNYNSRIPQVNNFRMRVYSGNSLFWKNIWLPAQVRKLGIEVMHFPAYTGTFVNIGNNIVTVHDVIHKVNPGWFSRRELLLIEIPIYMAIKKATRIIAVSESTKADIVKYYKIDPGKITVTLEAADDSFRPIKDPDPVEYIRDRYGIDTDFILYVGVLFKRRNIPRLLEAFSLLKQDKGIRHKLVIAGPKKSYSDLEESINKYGLKNEVIYLGYVSQQDMPLLYNAASFFVYPSLYEGFGLPVLEAMYCGKAVITSNVSSLPEIVGEAGLLINPCSTAELYDGMYRLIKDGSLRDTLGKKALERSKIFSWEKMAQETIAIYRELAT